MNYIETVLDEENWKYQTVYGKYGEDSVLEYVGDENNLYMAREELRTGKFLSEEKVKKLMKHIEENDYCFICDNHPSHGHSTDCPFYEEAQ